MKKGLKRVFKGLGVFAALLVVVVAVLLWRVDSVVKNAVEKGAPALLGCAATVEKVSVRFFKGSIMVKNLRLASPAGYEEEAMFAIEELRVKVDVGSVLKKSGPVVINEIIVHSPVIAYEVVNGKTNFEAVMARFPSAEKTEKPKEEKSPGRKVVIDHVEFRGGQVNVRTAYTLGFGVPLPLPPVELRDVGRASGGVTAVQAFGTVFASLYSTVTDLVFSSADFIKEQAGNLVEGAGKAGKAVIETGKDAIKGIKDLF
ncbi:MAG: hypothetical protein FWF96_07735 [Kiritimatiellaeota bacterium]|nr:hypothetical protein [Kiritimatiellota bacterium]